ncbi:protein translocase subunit SecF [Sphingomonas turrisvirgatae]|uniref:Protein-export membrane protein SecF n=1 Tax=Sphingomonas turrisvirgatae TaxID=1888892 RepID=A0A1E3M0D1_9SPHN|nr:protein translocase subunit SecF [Sphingomonas turrisvirgatae]ODP39441.1 protein-export membrane protein SecF [Sphingomonas turrisvirgatae]
MRPLKLVPDNTNIDFMGFRHWATAITVLMVVVSIAFLVMRGLNFGIDFVGGQNVRVTFAQPVQLDTLRERVDALGYGESTIQQFGSAKDVAIRMPVPGDEDGATARATAQVREVIAKNYPGARVNSVEAVSGKVSGELFEKGALALGLAMLAIAIYIWFRFEWQFGVGALLALAQDMIVTLGFFAATQLEFNLNTVAALLTIIGYSLNDKIVIFDRVRENLRKYRKMEIIPLLNLSINETLARTVMTSLTLVIALAALVILGPDVIFGFSLAMLLGIAIGTWSSMFVGNGILIQFKVGPGSFKSNEDKAAEGAAKTGQVSFKDMP